MQKLIPVFLCLLLSACNLPTSSENDIDLNNQAATIVAMTLDAQSITPTRENTPLPTATLAMTSSVTPSITPSITPTYSVPMLKVLEPTNCRNGPGQSFDILFTLLAGASVEIVGRYPVNNYWVVKVEGLGTPCWVWGEFVSTSGSTWTVPSITPPPTQTPRPATQPSNLKYNYTCTYNGVNSDVAVTLTWTDQANDELGYRVFRDNQLVSELPANSTAYSGSVKADSTQKLTYSVSAYNSAGESGRSSITFSCQ